MRINRGLKVFLTLRNASPKVGGAIYRVKKDFFAFRQTKAPFLSTEPGHF